MLSRKSSLMTRAGDIEALKGGWCHCHRVSQVEKEIGRPDPKTQRGHIVHVASVQTVTSRGVSDTGFWTRCSMTLNSEFITN